MRAQSLRVAAQVTRHGRKSSAAARFLLISPPTHNRFFFFTTESPPEVSPPIPSDRVLAPRTRASTTRCVPKR